MKNIQYLYYMLVAVSIGILGFVFAIAPTWVGSNVNYTAYEDSVYSHNLTVNITDFNNDVTFAIDTETSIVWTNASGSYNVSSSFVSSWISITNPNTGNLSINATRDNQTGFFSIPIQGTNSSDSEASVTIFEFIINATNDAPNITYINSTYNFSAASPLYGYINLSDEEEHYPLTINVSFNLTNCTHAAWSPYSNNQNCSLFDLGMGLSYPDNISALINFTPTNNHVGLYWANVSVIDRGGDYPCPHNYCDNTTYKTNKTRYYSAIVPFRIEGSLEINTSACDNPIFNESAIGLCNVTIKTKEPSDGLNISTYAILRNYADGQSGVYNTSWFQANKSATSSSNQYVVEVNVTPSKREIGNWTINFTVTDDNGDTVTQPVYVFVNRSSVLNDAPDIFYDNLPTGNFTSVNLRTVINLSVYDDDLLIPDKNDTYGGYNETSTFTIYIYNRTTLVADTITGFDVDIVSMPVAGTNRTFAQIDFTPASDEMGNYTINVSVMDRQNSMDFFTFNLSIINNTAPVWLAVNSNVSVWENNLTYLDLSQNVSDADGDTLIFNYTLIDSKTFASFNSTTAGIVNFTANDSSVGQHLMNITVSDGYFTDTEQFNFTVLNVNDAPDIQSMTSTNATPTSGITNASTINMTEDNYTILSLFIEDDDFMIPSTQALFYNESLTLNLTISGANTSLLNFVSQGVVGGYPNRTQYNAIFTPGKNDIGNYNVTINATDKSNSSVQWIIYFIISSVEHDPVLSTLSNQTSAINRSFYYDINVTDTEDGNDTLGTNTNFTFSYNFTQGTDFINNNASIFNKTTGILSYTFNSSQSGIYKINITVNDSGGRTDSEGLWINVYGLPTLVSPGENSVINLTENSSSVLNFTMNHSIGDNLTYLFYIDTISYNGSFNYGDLVLRNSTNYYGNATPYNWSFTPNMTDETYGMLKNLTIIVYPNSSNLTNNSQVNSTFNFKLNISHANSGVSLYDNIDNQSSTYGSAITINLYEHFSDSDHNDPYYIQNLTFTPTLNTSSITYSVSSAGVLTLSATVEVAGVVYVTATDGIVNATSNNFTVRFTAPASTTTTTTTTSGGTVEIPVSLKIIMPDPVSAYKGQMIELPLTLENDGNIALKGITLSGSVVKDGKLVNDINISFSKTKFDSLASGDKENLTMTLFVDTEIPGTYEITVKADVVSPKYTDWGKMYLTIKEGKEIIEKLVFTEEFIASNPECVELSEMVKEARDLFNAGKTAEAIEKSNEALNACNEAIKQPGRSLVKEVVEDKVYRYLIISTIVAIALGVAFYTYKRIKLVRRKKLVLQEIIKNKNNSF